MAVLVVDVMRTRTRKVLLDLNQGIFFSSTLKDVKRAKYLGLLQLLNPHVCTRFEADQGSPEGAQHGAGCRSSNAERRRGLLGSEYGREEKERRG